MAVQPLGIIMHGVTGRMGMNQHLIRSICAIRAQGGVTLSNGDKVMPDPILIGRNAEKMEALFSHWLDAKAIDTAFICGPEPMMLAIAGSLRTHGLRDDQIKFELFASGQPGRAKAKAVSKTSVAPGAGVETTVTLDGATRNFTMPREGQTILEAAIEAQMDAPYSCKAGVCSTCRCKVLEGEVEMAVNHALEDYEVRAGYVLSCQAVPLSDRVVVTYDE